MPPFYDRLGILIMLAGQDDHRQVPVLALEHARQPLSQPGPPIHMVSPGAQNS